MRALAGSTRVQVHYGALGGADLTAPLTAPRGLAAGAGLADMESLLHRSGPARPRVLLIDESDAFVLGLQDGRYCYRVPLQQRLIRQDAPRDTAATGGRDPGGFLTCIMLPILRA